MSVEQGGGEGVADVRPIFRKGDRLLVKFPFGSCEMVVQRHAIKSGRVWLYGMCYGFVVLFFASQVIRRITLHQAFDYAEDD